MPGAAGRIEDGELPGLLATTPAHALLTASAQTDGEGDPRHLNAAGAGAGSGGVELSCRTCVSSHRSGRNSKVFTRPSPPPQPGRHRHRHRHGLPCLGRQSRVIGARTRGTHAPGRPGHGRPRTVPAAERLEPGQSSSRASMPVSSPFFRSHSSTSARENCGLTSVPPIRVGNESWRRRQLLTAVPHTGDLGDLGEADGHHLASGDADQPVVPPGHPGRRRLFRRERDERRPLPPADARHGPAVRGPGIPHAHGVETGGRLHAVAAARSAVVAPEPVRCGRLLGLLGLLGHLLHAPVSRRPLAESCRVLSLLAVQQGITACRAMSRRLHGHVVPGPDRR